MTTVYLVRHAEAEGNIYRRFHGHFDAFVTPNGYAQLDCLKKRFCSINLDKVFSSDLTRAKETARAVLGDKQIPFIVVPELREIYGGEWEDRPWGEFHITTPEECRTWDKDFSNHRCPKGESVRELFDRAKDTILRIVRENAGKKVAIVSHGAFIRCFMTYAAGLDVSDIEKTGWVDNTAVTLLEFDEELRPNMVFKGDTSHLSEENSTLLRQKWWRNGVDMNLYFMPAKREDYDNKIHVIRGQILKENRGGNGKDIEGKGFWGLYNGDEIGYLELSGDKEQPAFITVLYSIEPHRGTGCAAQLLGQAISELRKDGQEKVFAEVGKDNVRALSFFYKYGFKIQRDTGYNTIILEMGI